MDFVGIDKFSLLDFDGYISVVLFAPKCNFRCPFCHNGQSVLSNNSSIPFNEIIDYLNSRKGVIDAIVVTGGEPTLMDDLFDKISTLKKMGYLIKLDTNGTNPEMLQKLIHANLLDYIAMDIKNGESMYMTTSGVKCLDINLIKESISLIMNSGIDYEFRTTLVKEYHSLESIKEMSKLVNGANRLYLQHFIDREGVILPGLHDVSFEEASLYKEELSKYVKSCQLRGY